MNGDVGMGCTVRKIAETRKSHNISKDTSTIMRNSLPEYIYIYMYIYI